MSDERHGALPDDASDAPVHAMRRRRSTLSRRTIAAFIFGLLLLGAAALYRLVPPIGLSSEETEDLVYSTIQQELPAAFLVTGYLETTAQTRVSNTRTFLPGLLDLNLGTTRAAVRVPGRVAYGFDVRALDRADIQVGDDGVVVIALPEPRVHSVEPALEAMEVETDRGWARISSDTETEVRQRAIELVRQTLRTQGERHLATSSQPRINSARALARLLRPALEAAGVEKPQFRFQLSPEILYQDPPADP